MRARPTIGVDISDHVSSPGDADPLPRFLKPSQVGPFLGCSDAQVHALLRHAAIPAIKVGGRGQWRIETGRASRVPTRPSQA